MDKSDLNSKVVDQKNLNKRLIHPRSCRAEKKNYRAKLQLPSMGSSPRTTTFLSSRIIICSIVVKHNLKRCGICLSTHLEAPRLSAQNPKCSFWRIWWKLVQFSPHPHLHSVYRNRLFPASEWHQIWMYSSGMVWDNMEIQWQIGLGCRHSRSEGPPPNSWGFT